MFDLAIIGGGPAGYAAAIRASELGLSTVLFEQRLLGGTCLNRGCVPTKYLAHVSELCRAFEGSAAYGISAQKPELDYRTTIARKDELVETLRLSLQRLLLQHKIEVIPEHAVVLDAGIVAAAGCEYRAGNILIAAGAEPRPAIVRGTVSSEELLELTRIPAKLGIIGGGVTAVEFAHIFAGLGSQVTLFLRSDRILRRFDKELAVSLTQSFKKRGIRIVPNCTAAELENADVDVMLSAVGRVPHVEGLFPGNAVPAMDHGICTDSEGRTSVPGIFAAGDVCAGSPQLAHVAMAQGERIAQLIAGKAAEKAEAVVSCVYTKPEIACVGLTEAEAKGRNIAAVVGKQPMHANARTLIEGGERGFIKLVADGETHRLIGAQLMCERASDIVSEAALAIQMGLTVEELADSVRPHPTFCEEMTAAARIVRGKLS